MKQSAVINLIETVLNINHKWSKKPTVTCGNIGMFGSELVEFRISFPKGTRWETKYKFKHIFDKYYPKAAYRGFVCRYDNTIKNLKKVLAISFESKLFEE